MPPHYSTLKIVKFLSLFPDKLRSFRFGNAICHKLTDLMDCVTNVEEGNPAYGVNFCYGAACELSAVTSSVLISCDKEFSLMQYHKGVGGKTKVMTNRF